MKINTDKTKFMIFDLSMIYQFNNRLKLGGNNLDQVQETKLLGLIIRDNLSWRSNRQSL